ncbi:MAG: 3-keto-5-aminohexanoate cleavage protein [Pseudomonadota bacterium]
MQHVGPELAGSEFVLQACLNGAHDPAQVAGLPVTPAALATEAAAAVAAGAAELHIHPRGPDGAESLAPGDVAAALDAVRAALPGLPVGIGTGAWIAPGGRARHASMAAWTTQPDYASVNLGEPDALEVMTLLTRQGVGIEAGLWNQTDAARFLAEAAPSACLRIMIEMQDVASEAALREADTILAMLADAGIDRPILLHGEGRSAWAMVARAAALGLDTRIGLEDVTHMPDGRPATSNADLVAAARKIMAEHGVGA